VRFRDIQPIWEVIAQILFYALGLWFFNREAPRIAERL
jgi:ABC-type polysaccharide/polyol phosphate export permease